MDKHLDIWRECKRVLAHGGLLIVNVSNHIRKGAVIDVVDFHKEAILNMGLTLKCECNEFKYLWRAGLKEGNSAETDRAKAAWYRKKAEELRGNTLSSEIAPLSEDVAQELAESIERSNEAYRELTEQLPELMESICQQVGEKHLKNVERYVKSSFLSKWYWKRKVDKSKTELENILEATAKWRQENLK